MILTYEELITKSDLARVTALKCNSDWGRQFWMSVSEKLMERALNLPLSTCRKEAILREASMRG